MTNIQSANNLQLKKGKWTKNSEKKKKQFTILKLSLIIYKVMIRYIYSRYILDTHTYIKQRLKEKTLPTNTKFSKFIIKFINYQKKIKMNANFRWCCHRTIGISHLLFPKNCVAATYYTSLKYLLINNNIIILTIMKGEK